MTIDEAKDEARAAIDGAELLERVAERVGMRAQASAVFGEPVERDGVTVIPVARAAWGFGGGSGDDPSGQAGSGGGGGVAVSPVGYIEVRGDRAEFRPLPARRGRVALAAVGAGLLGAVLGARAKRG